MSDEIREGFIIRLRGAPPALVAREFSCPNCGRWDTTVTREDLDYVNDGGMLRCPACDAMCALAVSAVAVHTQFVVSASRGRNDAKPNPRAMDTRALAEGQSMKEWRAERAKIHEADRHRRVKELLE